MVEAHDIGRESTDDVLDSGTFTIGTIFPVSENIFDVATRYRSDEAREIFRLRPIAQRAFPTIDVLRYRHLEMARTVNRLVIEGRGGRQPARPI